MKALVASTFALTLIGATAADAEGAGARVHIGNVGSHHRNFRRSYHRHRRCVSWSYRHHERYCRRWGY